MSGAFDQFKQWAKRWIPDKKKGQFFLIFVFVSALLWLLTRFSNSYKSPVEFKIAYVNLPKGVVITNAPETLKATIEATGFQLLLYQLFGKTLTLDMQNSALDENQGSLALIPLSGYLENQLFEKARINRINNPNFLFSFERLSQKKVAVVLTGGIEFKAGYSYISPPKIFPDSVTIFGIPSVTNSIDYISTTPINETEQTKGFQKLVSLNVPEKLDDISHRRVIVEADVAQFTELSFQVPVQMVNLPDSVTIKLFPKTVQLMGLVPRNQIDSISAKDFLLTADYATSNFGARKTLSVQITEKPSLFKVTKWIPQQLDYLIRQ